MPFNVEKYNALKTKATTEEKVIIDCIIKNKGFKAAAEELSMNHRTLRSTIERVEKRGSINDERSKHLYLRKFEAAAEFVAVWNAPRKYPTVHDMLRALQVPNADALMKRKVRYDKFKKENPKANVPELIWRRPNGRIVSIPKRAFDQLNPFKISTKTVQQARGLIITGAQFGSTTFLSHLDSLKNYSEKTGYPLVVMPIKYGPITTDETGLTSTFPDELAGHMIFEDILLAEGNLNLNVARFRPTLTKFLTDQVCQMGGHVSQIYAAPVHELEHRSRLEKVNAYPKAIMTTGSVTVPNYSVDKLGQQDRTGELAEENHVFGALLVEFDKDNPSRFHFRHLTADENGCFYDIDTKRGGAVWITPDEVTHKPDAVSALILGDWHTGKTEPTVRNVTFGDGGMVQKLKPQDICLHDFVDCDSVSHWEKNQAPRRAWKGPLQHDSLEIELKEAVAELKWMGVQAPFAKLHVVCSNHNEYVREYVETMRWTKDDINLGIGAELFSAMTNSLKDKKDLLKVNADPIDPVVWYFNKFAPEVHSLERKDTLLLPREMKDLSKAILASMHGDIGPGGKQTRSNASFLKLNQRVVLGHNHTATIYHWVMRVGTSTPRMQHYVTTPSTSWTNTHCAIFENGQAMLLNIIHGKYHR